MRDNFKRRDIFRKLHQAGYDIVYLQETHSQKKDELRWKNEWGGRIIFAHGTNKSCGTLILLKKSLPLKIVETIIDEDEGRYIIANINYEGNDYTLCNIYGPNSDRPQFFQNVFSQLETIPNDFRITAGDWNLIWDHEKDKNTECVHSNVKARELLIDYAEQEELVDIWRLRNPEEFRFT